MQNTIRTQQPEELQACFIDSKLSSIDILLIETRSPYMELYLLYYRPHPKDGGGNVFSLFVSPHLDWGGVYPVTGLGGGG